MGLESVSLSEDVVGDLKCVSYAQFQVMDEYQILTLSRSANGNSSSNVTSSPPHIKLFADGVVVTNPPGRWL